MIVKLLTERHLEFLSLKGGCRGSSESTLVKMSNCWKSRALAHMSLMYIYYRRKSIDCCHINGCNTTPRIWKQEIVCIAQCIY